MISSFGNRFVEDIFHGNRTKQALRLHEYLHNNAQDKLDMINLENAVEGRFYTERDSKFKPCQSIKMIPKNRRPAHPGKILLAHFLNPLGITQTKFVEHLGGTWSSAKLCNIIHEKRSVTPAIALDFSDALKTTPEFWLNLQQNYDLWETIQSHKHISPVDEVQAG